jgi:hypothetical protein
MEAAPAPPPAPMPMPISQEMQYDPPIDPAMPVSSHLTAIAEAAQNHALLQEANMHHEPQPYPMYHEPSMPHPLHDPALLQEPLHQETKVESSSSEASMNGHLHPSYRETTPSLGKRPADDLERLATGIKPKRKPKEKWAHRLGCPFRKCRGDMFTTEHGFRVCETTPHEFIIRLIEHMKRNHDLYVCGECFLGYKTPDALNSHKTTSHHCGKCYMSFPDAEIFAKHANSCMTVDAATQEDIWQILYETLCADGVRHNPSFDDDTPVDSAIQSNNRVRMQLLSQQPLAIGQVPSLAKQLGSPASGNGMAPPVERADEYRQQLVPVGAMSLQAGPDRASPPMGTARTTQLLFENESQRDTIQALQGLLAAERQARLEAEVRADIFASAKGNGLVHAAIRRFISSVRQARLAPVKPRYESGWVEEMHELQGDTADGIQIITSTPVLQQYAPSVDDYSPAYATMEMLPILLPQPAIPTALHCPSLTSESTAQSLLEPTAPLFLNLPSAVMYDTGKDATATATTTTQPEPPFAWGQLWGCQICGAQLQQASEIFCDTCAALDGY